MELEANVVFIIYIFCLLYLFIHFYYEKNFKMYALVYIVQFLDKSCEQTLSFIHNCESYKKQSRKKRWAFTETVCELSVIEDNSKKIDKKPAHVTLQ